MSDTYYSREFTVICICNSTWELFYTVLRNVCNLRIVHLIVNYCVHHNPVSLVALNPIKNILYKKNLKLNIELFFVCLKYSW